MPHKAGKEFFESKKEWSRRKDIILGYYLDPYLAKVARLNKPILIVDGFAGAGRFSDGEGGSPLVICEKVKTAVARGTNVAVWCIEQDPQLTQQLGENIKNYVFAQVKPGTFDSYIPQIESTSITHSVFLYLDPFTIEGIEWASLDRVFAHLASSRSSVEFLFNFNVQSLVRRGLAALKMNLIIPKEEADPADEKVTPIERLNQFVGGDWWADVLRKQTDFAAAVSEIGNVFCKRLATRFNWVCQHPVKAKVNHLIPKYVLVFGSRHPDALLLMNEAMVKSREYFADVSAPAAGTLFEMRPTELIPDKSRLPELLLRLCDAPLSRKNLTLKVIRNSFCDFSETEIRQCVAMLVKNKKLHFKSETSKLNDASILWKT